MTDIRSDSGRCAWHGWILADNRPIDWVKVGRAEMSQIERQLPLAIEKLRAASKEHPNTTLTLLCQLLLERDASAIYEVAKMFEMGHLVDQEPDTAALLFWVAHQCGSPLGALRLSKASRTGDLGLPISAQLATVYEARSRSQFCTQLPALRVALKGIIENPTGNVVPLRGRGTSRGG